MTSAARVAIAGVELRLVALPLRRAHVAAHGIEGTRRVVLVRLVDAQGNGGWGECSTLSTRGYADEDTFGAWHELQTSIAPAVLAGSGLPTPCGPMAVAAIAGAAASLDACLAGRSLADVLAREVGSGVPREAVPSTAVVAVEDDVEVLLREVQLALDAGHRGVKVKIRPGWDTVPLKAIRATWPKLWLAADANGSYAGEAEGVATLAPFELAYLEQPLAPDDLHGHAALGHGAGPPVALDESVISVAALRAIAACGAAGAVNLKPARLGGPRAATAALAVARELGLDAWCGGMLETGVGRAIALAVAAQQGFTLPSDLGPSARYFAEDLVEPVAVMDGQGAVAVPDGAGLGVAVRPDRLDAVTERRWTAGELAT